MDNTNQEYSLEREIQDFFSKTSATRSDCDTFAEKLVGGNISPVEVQGSCSYSVYAGPVAQFVVQFRLKSLELALEKVELAKKIFGPLAPEVSFKGQIGNTCQDKEPLCVYLMARISGVSHLDFILSHNLPENSSEYQKWRKTLVEDVAK